MARNDPENPAIILNILIRTFQNWDFGDLWDGLDYCRLNQDGRDEKRDLKDGRNDPEYPAIILNILIRAFQNWDYGDLWDELDCCCMNQDGQDEKQDVQDDAGIS